MQNKPRKLFNSKLKARSNGFSMIELIAIIGVLAILIAVLAPSLLTYTERTRAGRDVSAMDEVTNAFFVGISNEKAYDEVLQDSINNNISCYIDQSSELAYEEYIVRTGTVGGGTSQYSFSNEARKSDETTYYVGGNMRGITVTFEPHKLDNSTASYYEIKDGIINKYTSSTPELLTSNPNLYAAVKEVVGESIKIASQTYRNSEFTVFIRIGTTGDIGGSGQTTTAAYGQYSGTNLSPDAPEPQMTTDRVTDPSDGADSDVNTDISSGNGTPNFDDSDLAGSGDFIPSDDIVLQGAAYAIYSNADGSLTFVRSPEEIKPGDIYNNKIVTEVYTGFETERYTVNWDTWQANTPWDDHYLDITKVIVQDEIRPLSTAAWFFYFKNCTYMDLEKLDTKYTTDMSWMFAYNTKLRGLNVSTFDTSRVFGMEGMFCGMKSLDKLDVSNFDTSSATDMSNMFYNCESLTVLDLTNFDTWNVEQTYWMFADCYNLRTIYASSENWIMANVEVSNDMFNNSTRIVGGAGTKFDYYYIDKEYAEIDRGETRPGYLTEKYESSDDETLTDVAYAIYSEDDNSLTFIRADSEPVVGEYYDGRIISGVWDGFEEQVYGFMRAPWYRAGINNDVYTVRFDGVIRPISTAYWFAGFQNCEYINLTKLDTAKTRSMDAMFCCTGNNLSASDSFTIVGLDTLDVSKVSSMVDVFAFCAERAGSVSIAGIESWKPSSCTTMSGMFYLFAYRNHTGDFTLDLSGWDVSHVRNFKSMFSDTARNATNFHLILNGWDTASAQNMSCMFESAGANATTWRIDGLSGFETKNVTDMSNMFYGTAPTATTLEVADWNTSSVTSMHGMFSSAGADDFELDLTKWNTSKVVDMGSMFCSTGGSNVNIVGIENWNVSNVANMGSMFQSYKATTLDLSNWDTRSLTNTNYMFYGCTNLKTIYVSDWWSLYKVPNANSTTMFTNCKNIVGQSGTTYNSSKVDKSMANYETGYLTYKGSVIEPPYVAINIDNQCPDKISVNVPSKIVGGRTVVTLSTVVSGRQIESFKLNGELITGDSFVIPVEGGDFVISDAVIYSSAVLESAHHPYGGSATYQKTFPDATRVVITLTCQFARSNDYVDVYRYVDGSRRISRYTSTTGQTWTIEGETGYVQIYFRSNAARTWNYGFRAYIKAYYD